ncbi:MAG: RNA polymerase sigma factor [bacterium]|nr:RNA polymerase sigma factor [bacterium]
MTDEEKTIIRECLDGNRDAFELLVNRYEPHVKTLAWNITGNPEDAVEVSQEAFLQAFKNLHRCDLNKNFKNWLLGITFKRGIDKIRKQKSFRDFFTRYIQVAPTKKEEITLIEESPVFLPLLKILNEKERTALSLQMNENCSAGEIGGILNCSENAARVTLFRAKRKLKQELLKQC